MSNVGRANRLRSARALVVSAVALCLAVTAGCKRGSTSTTSATAVPVAATVTETSSNTVAVGGSVFYSFPVPQYGTVELTLTDVQPVRPNPDFDPSVEELSVGIGAPAGVGCTLASSITTAPGSTVQLSGAYGPGIFCIKVFDSGLLTAPVVFTAKVAHP